MKKHPSSNRTADRITKPIIHLIPIDGIGGVEQAARSITVSDALDIEVALMAGNPISETPYITSIGRNSSINSPLAYLQAVKYLINRDPKLIIFSLWRSAIVGTLYLFACKLLGKKPAQTVLFLHNTRYFHPVDKIAHKTFMRYADRLWCDSKKTLEVMVPSSHHHSANVISFFVPIKKNRVAAGKNFVYWGRLSPTKSVPTSIKIFNLVEKAHAGLKFYIFGPDDGALDEIKSTIRELDLEGKVILCGPKPPSEFPDIIYSCGVYVSASENEGMAISVVEAMQLGLVPVVVPAGEIGNYCVDGENSLYIDRNDLPATVEKLFDVLRSPPRLAALSNSARLTWTGAEAYSSSLSRHAKQIINL